MPDSGVAQNVSIPAGVNELLYLPQHFLTCHLPRAAEIMHQLLFLCSLASLLMLPPPPDLYLPDSQPQDPLHTHVPRSAQAASRAATSGSG